MGLKKPIISQIAKNTYAVNEFGMSTMYVLIGTERALLIDTACGLCDLRELMKSLTDLPYDVVLTHGHGDHVGGCTAFEEVWLHEADFPMLENFDEKMLTGYIAGLTQADREHIYEVPREYAFTGKLVPALKPLQDGQIFDLGGRQVSVLHTPGHTPGSCCLIDSGSRILFSGDACNFNQLVMASSIRTTVKGLYKLREHRNEFDQNYSGHVGHIFGGEPDCRSQKDYILDQCIAACEGILDGTAEIVSGESENFAGPTYVVYGGVKLSFDPERVGE